VDNNWAEIADHIETIEELYEASARPNAYFSMKFARLCVSFPRCRLLPPTDALQTYLRTTSLKTDSLLPSSRVRCTTTWSSLKSL